MTELRNIIVLDSKGEPLKKGDLIELIHIPDELLFGLPAEDQKAIKTKLGSKLPIQDIDNLGDLELEFTVENNVFHTIWVHPFYATKTKTR